MRRLVQNLRRHGRAVAAFLPLWAVVWAITTVEAWHYGDSWDMAYDGALSAGVHMAGLLQGLLTGDDLASTFSRSCTAGPGLCHLAAAVQRCRSLRHCKCRGTDRGQSTLQQPWCTRFCSLTGRCS